MICLSVGNWLTGDITILSYPILYSILGTVTDFNEKAKNRIMGTPLVVLTAAIGQ